MNKESKIVDAMTDAATTHAARIAEYAERGGLTASQIRHRHSSLDVEMRQLSLQIAMTFFQSPQVDAHLSNVEGLLREAEKVRVYLESGDLPQK